MTTADINLAGPAKTDAPQISAAQAAHAARCASVLAVKLDLIAYDAAKGVQADLAPAANAIANLGAALAAFGYKIALSDDADAAATMAAKRGALDAADEAWDRALRQAFGRDAGGARYDSRGQGKPGSALRILFNNRRAAFYAAHPTAPSMFNAAAGK